MAKRAQGQRLTVKRAVAPPPVAIEGQEDSGFPEAISLINSISSQREGVEWDIRVYQLPASGFGGRGNKNTAAFLFSVELDDLPTLEANLANQYPGGGSFRVQIRQDNQIFRNIGIEIAPRPGYKPPPPSYLTPAQLPEAAPAAAPANAFENFLLVMQRQQEAADARLEKLIAALAGNKPAAPTLLEQIQTYAEIQKAMGGGKAASGIEELKTHLEFAKSLAETMGNSGGGGESGGILGLVEKLVTSPLVGDIVKNALTAAATAQPQPAPALAGPQPAPTPAPMPPNFAPAPPSQFTAENPQAVMAIDYLVSQAIANADPAALAPQVIQMLPEEVLDELENQPDVAAFVIGRFAKLEPHRAWLEKLISEMWIKEAVPAAGSPALNDPDARIADSPPNTV